MDQRRIGDRTVGAIGLGGMPMSVRERNDEELGMRTIHAALDAGVTLIDTADAYHIGADEVGHNESLIARALVSDMVAYHPQLREQALREGHLNVRVLVPTDERKRRAVEVLRATGCMALAVSLGAFPGGTARNELVGLPWSAHTVTVVGAD